MKLVRLYSNKPSLFASIQFNDGLSVILAEVRRTENRGKTVHNLGKSTVARLVDFCLLKRRHSSFFLFKHAELFSGFTFFLEIKLGDGSYLTIARTLESRNPISILTSKDEVPNAQDVEADLWDHIGLGLAPAKRLLDGLLGFSVIAPYDYRDIMGYVLREQDDYGDVFHLRKFRGKHQEWKPFLAHLLGLNANLTLELYEENARAEELDRSMVHHRREGGAAEDADVVKIEGIIGIRQRDLSELEKTLESFNFSQADAEANRELVERVEDEISKRNEETYRLSQLLTRLDESLQEEAILFSPDQTAQLFSEAGVAFAGQIKKDFEQLVAFNRAISDERREYLLADRADTESRLSELGPQLEELQLERARLFDFLEGSDTLSKYKEVSGRVISLRADIYSLERQRNALNEIVRLKQDQRQIQDRKNQLQTAIEQDVQAQAEDTSGRYREIQGYFDEIIHTVLDEHALLSVSVSSTGSLDFSAEIVDSTGSATSASRGFTFKKLLCIAFDLAVLRAYREEHFPRFSFHDGVFESLEPRAKRRLIEVLRKYAELGLQPVITTLDSDLPDVIGSSGTLVSDEVVCRLHDDGDAGRLFKMRSF
ncbi:DUF2326 domain-containing protein [Paenarthrobacter sp. NPDC057981]|uniref:DUF2326 domain-containing protein n=1 Tax=Paenarthrobacter sp. NPDC057981 TaxID=3346297 RepID=UPI0036D8ACF0